MTTKRRSNDWPPPVIYDYDVSAGTLSDDQLARTDIDVRPETDFDRQVERMRRGETYVPATTRQLPSLPPGIMSAESDDANFALASAQALAAGAGGVFEHTSAEDRTRADLWRAGGYALFGTVTGFGLILVVMADQPIGWFFVGVGMFGLIAAMLVHIASLRHSQAGVARMKVGMVRTMQKDRLDSRERLAREMTHAWVRLAESQMQHEERMEREQRRGRK